MVWDDDRPIGSCVVVWSSGPGVPRTTQRPDASAPELAHLYVGEGGRGRGAGTALVRAAELLIAGRGGDRCVLGVEVGNVAAVRLYERLGYRDTGKQDTYEYTWVDPAGGRHLQSETSRCYSKTLN